MISYICLLATVFANLSCADDMDNSKFDNMIPYGKQEVSYTYPKGEGNLRVLTGSGIPICLCKALFKTILSLGTVC